MIMRRWKGYEKGMNLGGWFSQCNHTRERYENFITKEDIKKLAGWGIDHVRLPVDYNLVENEDGSYREEGFGYINRAIDWCREYGLNMILDLHKAAGYSFDDGENENGFFEDKTYQERFYRLWEQFAKRFGKYKDCLAFELLNEITDKAFCDKWNEISGHCIHKIRAIVPDIYILVGGYWNNCVAAVKDLALPQDEYIVYNFHCYDPMLFTHQGATWVQGMPEDFRFDLCHTYTEYLDTIKKVLPYQAGIFPKMKCMDAVFGEEFFIKLFEEAVQIAEEREVPLYCGEYGVINRASAYDALQWYQAIHGAFVYYGIGRAAWNYREMEYGFMDEHFQEVLEDVKKYL